MLKFWVKAGASAQFVYKCRPIKIKPLLLSHLNFDNKLYPLAFGLFSLFNSFDLIRGGKHVKLGYGSLHSL